MSKRTEEWVAETNRRDTERYVREGKVFRTLWRGSRGGGGWEPFRTQAEAVAKRDDIRARQEQKSPNRYEKDPDYEPIYATVQVEHYQAGVWQEVPDTRIVFILDYGHTAEKRIRDEKQRQREMRRARPRRSRR